MSDESNVESTEQPETPDLDILVAKITADFDKRFQGFQGTLDRRDSEYRQMLDDLKTADLPPEEREQVQASKVQQERDALKRRIELLSMRKDFPEEVDLLDSLMEGKSMQDQMLLLSQFRKATVAEEPQGEEPEDQPTPVDKNNPSRRNQPSLMDAASKMNKELSEAILKNSGSEPGILARLRRG